MHDQLFKELLQEFFADFVEIVLPDVAVRLRLNQATLLDKETFTDTPEGRHRFLDLVAQVETLEGEEELLLIHVEIEADARGSVMDRRMWRYAMQLWLRKEKPVVPIVLYLRGGRPDVTEIVVESRFAGRQLASFTYWAFGLSRSRAAEYLDRPQDLVPALAALMDPGEHSRSEHRIRCLHRAQRAEVNDAQRFLLVNAIETYVQLDEAEREEYEQLLSLHSNEEVKRMEMTWADAVEAKGVEKGQLLGMRTLLMDLLERRFGPLSEETKKHLHDISSTEELSRLHHRAIEARSLDELGL